MSPLEITLLLHIYARPGHEHYMDSDASKNALARFFQDGLTDKPEANASTSPGSSFFDHGITLTALGTAHVKQLCALPLPRMVFVDSQGETIPED